MYLSASIHGHQLPCIMVKTKNHQQQGARYAPTPLGNICRTTAAVVLEGDGSFLWAQTADKRREKQTNAVKQRGRNCPTTSGVQLPRLLCHLAVEIHQPYCLHPIHCKSARYLLRKLWGTHVCVCELYLHRLPCMNIMYTWEIVAAGNQLFFLAVEHVGVRCANRVEYRRQRSETGRQRSETGEL